MLEDIIYSKMIYSIPEDSGTSLLSHCSDALGTCLYGVSKGTYIDDIALWCIMANRVFGENYIEIYPELKNGIMEETWNTLPNAYVNTVGESANAKMCYGRTIVDLVENPEDKGYSVKLLGSCNSFADN